MKFVKLFLIFGMILLIGNASAAYWVDNPLDCPNEPYKAQNSPVAGYQACGFDGSYVKWYDMTSINAPSSSATTTTNYVSGMSGYVIDCDYYDGNVAPYCDNDEAFWCDADSTLLSNHVQTICDADNFGSSSEGDCISGYLDCNGGGLDDPADSTCEVRYGVTAYPTGNGNTYNSTCGAVCYSNYYDCDSSGVGAGNGCEVQQGGACTVGGLPGTYSCSVDGGGSCIETGTDTAYSTSDPLLWGSQYGSGQLLNLTNRITNESFAVNGSGCLVFSDGSTQCIAGGSGANVSGTGSTSGVAFWTGDSQLGADSGNFFWNN
jgi:hypothetical protein